MACCRLHNKSCAVVHEAADVILQSDQVLQEFANKMNARTELKYKEHVTNSGLYK